MSIECNKVNLSDLKYINYIRYVSRVTDALDIKLKNKTPNQISSVCKDITIIKCVIERLGIYNAATPYSVKR